ncbi:molybdopterin-dependent oxidoreductase [Roseibium sp.]|uniref:nitrate reductase n=1 Tax=Roseibium sp. TaxID=1936156 RepID=UPI003515194F
MAGPDVTRTTCPYCGVGCGVLAARQEDGTVGVAGDPDHPANFGRLCSKGSALAETLSLEERLLTPRLGGTETDWQTALSAVADGFSRIIAEHGPDSVALYGSGQLLTEDYYVANKFMKGFIGTANIDTNSRLCMASSVAGHKRAFGSDSVPGCYEDLEQADLVVLVGSNFAWCHPVLFQRLLAAKEKRGTRLVVVDPRRTATAEAADMHLPIHPGSDVALFNGLFAFLLENDACDEAYVSAHTEGLAEALAAVGDLPMPEIAQQTGVDPLRLRQFYRLFAEVERTVTIYSQGVNQSSAGTDKVNAIINCHLLTGRIGREGMGPFSITGQPNAMGGREVGGLANQLAAHMEIENDTHRDTVSRFWDAPALAARPGLKAVDLFRAVGEGEIKAVWIMATNPAASLPEAGKVADALRRCELVIVSDVTATTRTAALADILLPARGWGEKDGTVTNSERRISRQRAFLKAPGAAKPDWWSISRVAQYMGFAGFDYTSAADIFREHAALSAFENDGTRDFDIGALARLDDSGYDALTPVQWPVPAENPVGEKRMFSNGRFFTESARAQFVPTPVRDPASAISASFPLVLNTGRIRDQWHTMTRTGKSARLSAHISEPFLEIHPDDAQAEKLFPADIACVESVRGKVLARVHVTDRQKPGNIFVPMHWTAPFSDCAEADRLVAGNVDPLSGQPELKHTPVRISKYKAAWYGFLLSRGKPDLAPIDYWAIARTTAGWRAEIAHKEMPEATDTFVRNLFGCDDVDEDELLSYRDIATGSLRFALVRNGILDGIFMMSGEPVAAARTWLVDRIGQPVGADARFRILAGQAGADQPDPGAIVCSCFGIGVNQIAGEAFDGACTVDAIGDRLNAGTNCGSCRAEIVRILENVNVKKAV